MMAKTRQVFHVVGVGLLLAGCSVLPDSITIDFGDASPERGFNRQRHLSGHD